MEAPVTWKAGDAVEVAREDERVAQFLANDPVWIQARFAAVDDGQDIPGPFHVARPEWSWQFGVQDLDTGMRASFEVRRDATDRSTRLVAYEEVDSGMEQPPEYWPEKLLSIDAVVDLVMHRFQGSEVLGLDYNQDLHPDYFSNTPFVFVTDLEMFEGLFPDVFSVNVGINDDDDGYVQVKVSLVNGQILRVYRP